MVMDIGQFAIWKSRNIEAKYKNWYASELELSKYSTDGKKSILYELKYDIKNNTAKLYKINWVSEDPIDSCKFDDIEQLLKKYKLDN